MEGESLGVESASLPNGGNQASVGCRPCNSRCKNNAGRKPRGARVWQRGEEAMEQSVGLLELPRSSPGRQQDQSHGYFFGTSPIAAAWPHRSVNA